MSRKTILKVLWILMFLVPPLILAILMGAKSWDTYWGNLLEEKVKAENERWSRFDYLPLTDAAFPNQIRKLIENSRAGSEMGRDQKLPLIIELATFFRAYSHGTYDAYRAFRLPPNVRHVWRTKNKWATLDEWMDGFGFPPASHQSPVEKKFEAYLIAIGGNGTVFSNYFTGVCFEQSRIVIHPVKQPIPFPWDTPFFDSKYPKSWLFRKAPFPNVGYFSQRDDYSYLQFEEDRLEQLVTRHGTIVVADCFFLIKRREPYPFLPVIVRLYWHPTMKRWLPDDVVVCDAAQVKGYAIPVF